MNAIGLVILLAVLTTVFVAERRWALLGVLAGAMFLTQGQAVNVFGFNLYAVRIVEVMAFIRVLIRGEATFISSLNGIDRSLLLLYGYSTTVSLLRSASGASYHIGLATDAFLCYFTFRGLMRSPADLVWFLRAFLLLLTPFAMCVLFESITQHNLFSSMGGLTTPTEFSLGVVAPEEMMRHGRLRCQGSFRHPILMGTLGASFFPLYVALGLPKGHRIAATVGIGLCAVIVWASNSGGPAGCALIGVFGWGLWHWRTRMRLVRRGLTIMILALTVVMKAPVWYLFARASKITGGGGWHRSFLIDTAFHHLSEWWFAGMPMKDTVDWFPYFLALTGAADLTNAFISFGLTAGLVAIGLLIVVLVCSYRQLGLALARLRAAHQGPYAEEYMLWGLGVMLAAHIVNWFGITYFDQIYVIWFMQLATISAVSGRLRHGASAESTQDVSEVAAVQEFADAS